MPKPPPVEYFEFVCRTPVATAGPIMAALTRMEGLDVSAPRLVSEIRSFAKNERTNHDVKAEAFLETWMKDHPTFRAKEAVQYFKADGRTSGACYTALRMLSADGRLKKLGEGMYSLPGVKALAAPKKAKKVKAAPKKHNDVPAPDFALRIMSRNHGKITSATLKGHFEKDGRAPTGVGPALNKLLKAKKIKALGEGLYELKKTEPKTNGAASPDTIAPGV